MIICPNCNHHNPDGSSQCENCYTPLPQTTSCPNCGASVQTDATFCGQCGFNLQVEMIESVINIGEEIETYPEIDYIEEKDSSVSIASEDVSSEKDLLPQVSSPWDEEDDNPNTVGQEAMPWEKTLVEEQELDISSLNASNSWEVEELPELYESDDLADLVNSIESLNTNDSEEIEDIAEPSTPTISSEETPDLGNQEDGESLMSMFTPEPEKIVPQSQPSSAVVTGLSSATQLQLQNAKLLHVQTNTMIEIPPNLPVVHIGKPNSQIPPDIDVSGLADSEVVSRIHADIRIEGDAHFIEDVGSSNGTYINHSPLLVGNRYRLRSGDRISLGKGDLVSFIFQLSE